MTRAALVLISLIITSNTSASEISCDMKWWKLKKPGYPALIQGQLKKKSEARIIHIEVWNNSGLIGTSMAFPNPRGIWDTQVYGDYKIKRSHRIRFVCE